MKWLLLGSTLVLAALAGCIDGTPNDDGSNSGDDAWGPAVRPVMPEDPMAFEAGHDHTDVEAHKFLWNYDFASRDPLLQDDYQIAGLHALDQQAGYLFGAMYGANAAGVNGGIAIWDLANPQAPALAGRLTIPGAVGGDRSMEATPDGNFVVLTTETFTCLGHVNVLGAAFKTYLIDVSDKANPVIADAITGVGPSGGDAREGRPTTGLGQSTGLPGEHAVAVHTIGDQDYAFVWGEVYRIERGDETLPAALVSTGAKIEVGHDMYVRDTPWGSVWGLAANGFSAYQLYDLSDPENPVNIGTWDIPDRDDLETDYYLHTSDVTFFADDEQALIVLSSEDWLEQPSHVWILDASNLWGVNASDISEPEVLDHVGDWENPGGHGADGLRYSLHNPRFSHDGMLTFSSYHGGLWQMDMRHPEFRTAPAEVAYALYAEGTQTQMNDPVFGAAQQNACGFLEITLDAPMVMDVEVAPDGTLYAADVFMGLYTFAPTADHPVFGA